MKKTKNVQISIIILSITLALSFSGCASKEKSKELNTTSSDVKQSETKEKGNKLFEGSWKVEREVKDPKNTIQTLMEIQVGSNDDVNISLSSAKIVDGNPNRIANLNLKGKIVNNGAAFDFSDDSWGHSGNVKLEFQKDKIIATITITKEPNEASLWGIEKGTLNFVRNKK